MDDEDSKVVVKLVENEEVFIKQLVDDKFQQLDLDEDGKLSLNQLRPAVADLGAALGLPPQGSDPQSDHIYSQVLNEFTHGHGHDGHDGHGVGNEDKVSKAQFKDVVSDILIGISAAGLKRDPIVILRIDGEDLRDFLSNGPTFEAELASIFSQSQADSPNASLRHYILNALQNLGVDQGLPPASDSWVMSNLVEPALRSIWNQLPVSEDVFFTEFKRVAENIADRLKEHPVIVAHTHNNFDGGSIKRLLANRFELDKVLNTAIETLPVARDRHGKMSKEHLRVALDSMAPSAGLPPYGAVEEMDKVTNNVVLKMLEEVDDRKLTLKQDEMKKLLKEILGRIMLQLEGNPISISTNSVVHEPFDSDPLYSLLQPRPPPTPSS